MWKYNKWFSVGNDYKIIFAVGLTLTLLDLLFCVCVGMTFTCVRVICRLTCGGSSHDVIYVCAVSVNAQLNALWAATLTEYGPMCKGESAEGDLCPARCSRGVKWEKHVVIEVGKCVSLPRKVFQCVLDIVCMNNWLPRHGERTFDFSTQLKQSLPVSMCTPCIGLFTYTCDSLCDCNAPTCCSLVWFDKTLSHLENSDSKCNRPWHRASSPPCQPSETF